MKTYVASLVSGLAAAGLLSSCASTGQLASNGEYDDLYFTASDRNTVEFVKLNEPQRADYEQGSYVFDQQSYSSKNVNPEYVAKYSNSNNVQSSVDNAPAQDQEYYVEETDRNTFDGVDEPRIVNNFYGPMGRFGTFGNPAFAGWGANPFFHDPFMMDPFFDPFWGPTAFARPGLNFGLSVGFGWGFGNPWGFNRWNRWGDPFWGGGFGSPWGFGNAYAMGFRNGFYGGGLWNRPSVVIINNENMGVARRNITRGRSNQRISRSVNNGESFATRGRSTTTGSRNAVTRGSSTVRNARGTSNRDFTATQNEYYSRSRANARSAETSRIMRSSTPATRGSRSYSPAEANRRSSRFGNYNRARSTSPSRSYSSPSYNRGSRSYGSTSPSYNSGSRSRSSSPSYNRGSYGGSRSSGSYGRGSSSGSRSGGRSSRGGGGY
ncbi:MAG: hypothetical protein ACLFUB_13625 [Cyclobacteriaceae bacterium]